MPPAPDLPPEILEKIFSYLPLPRIALNREELLDRSIWDPVKPSNFLPLVARSWKEPARRYLLQTIKLEWIMSHFQIEPFVEGLERTGDGIYVKYLKIITSSSFFFGEAFINKPVFVKVIKEMPNLRRLDLITGKVNVVDENQFAVSNFSCLTSFGVVFSVDMSSLDMVNLITSILELAINIEDLNIVDLHPEKHFLPFEFPKNISSSLYHPLRRLRLPVGFFHHLFLSNSSPVSFLTVDSFKKLKEFTFRGKFFINPSNLIFSIFQNAGSTLKRIAIFNLPPIDLFLQLIKCCTVLEELFLPFSDSNLDNYLPVNFLHLLSPTIQVLRFRIPLQCLIYLHKYPRDELQIQQMFMPTNFKWEPFSPRKDFEDINLLPASVTTLIFPRCYQIMTLLTYAEENNLLDSLKQFKTFSSCSYQWCDETGKVSFLKEGEKKMLTEEIEWLNGRSGVEDFGIVDFRLIYNIVLINY